MVIDLYFITLDLEWKKELFAHQMAFQYDGIILDMFVQLYEILV
jgi:hypothetical protein